VIGEIMQFDEIASINTKKLGEALATRLGAYRIAMLKSHGSVIAAASILEAFVLAVYLEEMRKGSIWPKALRTNGSDTRTDRDDRRQSLEAQPVAKGLGLPRRQIELGLILRAGLHTIGYRLEHIFDVGTKLASGAYNGNRNQCNNQCVFNGTRAGFGLEEAREELCHCSPLLS
jgi:hypothetical protein